MSWAPALAWGCVAFGTLCCLLSRWDGHKVNRLNDPHHTTKRPTVECAGRYE